jgi:anaerobic selenocysteine-containing dehydrogenase
VAGLAAAFGSGAMTNTIADIEEADVILITGSNTTENHPVLSLCQTGRDPPGAKLIVVDPRRIKMTEFAENWLRPNLGTDVAWINGMMHVIISEDLHDKAFVEDAHGKLRGHESRCGKIYAGTCGLHHRHSG